MLIHEEEEEEEKEDEENKEKKEEEDKIIFNSVQLYRRSIYICIYRRNITQRVYHYMYVLVPSMLILLSKKRIGLTDIKCFMSRSPTWEQKRRRKKRKRKRKKRRRRR